MDAKASLHQEPLDVCVIEDVMDDKGSLHQKPRDICVVEDVIDDIGSLHQKPRAVCNTEDVESIGLVWFENTKLQPCEEWHSMFVTGGRPRLEITGHISVTNAKKGFCETVAEVMDAEEEGEDEFILRKATRPVRSRATESRF